MSKKLIKNADAIIVIQDAHVTETGTHQQLLEQGGEYARLIEAQSLFGRMPDQAVL